MSAQKNRGRAVILGAVLVVLALVALFSMSLLGRNSQVSSKSVPHATSEKTSTTAPTPERHYQTIVCKDSRGKIQLIRMLAPAKCPTLATTNSPKSTSTEVSPATSTQKPASTPKPTTAPRPQQTWSGNTAEKCPLYADKSNEKWQACWGGMTFPTTITPARISSCTPLDNSGQNWKITVMMAPLTGGNFGNYSMQMSFNGTLRGWPADMKSIEYTAQLPVVFYAWDGLPGQVPRFMSGTAVIPINCG